MTEVALFDLPLPEEPEPSQPDAVKHGCDYDFDGKNLMYYYNFIDYTWMLDGRSLHAKAYLDEIEKVVITEPETKFSDIPAFAEVLRFLQRRFAYIYTLEPEGYELRYKVRGAADPEY